MAFDPSQFKRCRAGVLGLGRSGLAVTRLLARKGLRVLASDSRPLREVRASAAHLPSGVSLEGGGHSSRLLKCAFVVKSPGLSPALPILMELERAGVPVFSELEVALAFSRAAEVVAVTGTNGKTTTTLLAGEIFKTARRGGRRVHVCGNIGRPASEAAPSAGPKDTLVLEVSSYQLEDSRWFRPHAGVLLNVTPDHLDHHGGMSGYLRAKARLFRDQGPGDLCVFNAGDPLTYKLSRDCPSRRLYFGPAGPSHAWVEGQRLRVQLPGARPVTLRPPALPGTHNLENAMAAALLALGRGLPATSVQKAFRAFKGVEHRIEEVGTFRGLRCVNDSKATNVDSTLVALKALAGNGSRKAAGSGILLILGGLHKGSPYTPLRPWLDRGVKGILTIGAAARKIEEDLGGAVPIFPCGDLRTAVETAYKIGSKGDTLLLSPACASFDQFRDFEDRGRRFKELVESLA